MTAGVDPALDRAREEMVRSQIEARGIRDPGVLAAMRTVPRHLFVPPELRSEAYSDRALPIGDGATISQPFIVAYMVEKLEASGCSVLEIGTGSGYETAVLSRVAAAVWTIEIIPELARRARRVLESLGAVNVQWRTGDGLAGWIEEAPFDRIVLTAAVEEIPPGLLEQLKTGGWFIGPVGNSGSQKLVRAMRTSDGFDRSVLIPVSFIEARNA